MAQKESWKGITLDERAKLIFSVNVKGLNKNYERPLSPFEVAEYLKTVLDNGGTKEELRVMLNYRDNTMIGKYLSILDLEDELRSFIDWGRKPGTVSVTNCFEGQLVKIKPKKDRKVAFEYAMKYNLNKLECQMIRQLHTRKFGNIHECAKEALKSRPKIVKNHLYLGYIKNSKINEKINELTRPKRNSIFKEILALILPNIRILGCSLNENSFSIVLTDKGNRKVKELLGEELENKIIEGIARELIK